MQVEVPPLHKDLKKVEENVKIPTWQVHDLPSGPVEGTSPVTRRRALWSIAMLGERVPMGF